MTKVLSYSNYYKFIKSLVYKRLSIVIIHINLNVTFVPACFEEVCANVVSNVSLQNVELYLFPAGAVS